MKIAFLGQPGSNSEQAVFEFFEAQEPVSCPSFEAVFEAVESGGCEAAIVPIENSTAGSVHQNYDLLLQRNLFIVGEHVLRVRHCLIALPGATKNEIRRVVSHPQALGQCAGYLRRLGVRVEAGPDTAGSVLLVKNAGERALAAVASRRAAEMYQMEIIEEGIEDDPQNYTRFLALASRPVVPSGEAKTSIVFTLPNRPGTLQQAIRAFARRGINLTKLETRPLPGRPWDYLFYLDFSGASREPDAQAALAELGSLAPMLRLLGSYPKFKPVS